MPDMFPAGLIVFFRQMGTDNMLARSVHLDARDVEIRAGDAHPEDYIILNKDGDNIGVYPRDWVAAILPIKTEGPAANADNQQTRRDSASAPAAGDSGSISGRAKGLDS